jgi:hypothetical protein
MAVRRLMPFALLSLLACTDKTDEPGATSLEGDTDTNTLATLDHDVQFPCGDASYTGGDPAGYDETTGEALMGAIQVKAAWMDLSHLDPRPPRTRSRPTAPKTCSWSAERTTTTVAPTLTS